MLSSLFGTGSQRNRRHGDRSPFSSPFTVQHLSPESARRSSLYQRRRPAADYDDTESTEDEEDEEFDEDAEDYVEEEDNEGDEDGLGESTPLLPIFSAAHLDALPIYSLTHTIRLLVVARCETTLSWDQLRSPQVSQFLLKPIQQEIRSSHFSRATEYALMANCLQFSKEMALNPGNSGTSKTRAMVCELLAMRLLKEFTTRELIDALSYDFYPLQGQAAASAETAQNPNSRRNTPAKQQPNAARTSCLEVAIRAQAKRFLAHPLVVQQLEAIWAGSIVFHNAADTLHRPPIKVTPNQTRGYGTAADNSNVHSLDVSPSKLQPAKQRDHVECVSVQVRRAVTLYDPRDASLFKLSRLRVPRYRQFLSTCSFAILLGLFLAVLMQRSLEITPLEIVFWFWSAGFMLDEIVGFNEQGFSLYLMSFWNTFDVGILLLLFVHYCLRLYGIAISDTRKHAVANMAYDVLAANAVLLFPRLFSVLDHYRYFSQLLIAFRLMATDLLALFILIIISCSGFFVAFTLSFTTNENDGPGAIAYDLFKILMGFTPAAWDRWPALNALGKTILTLFLFICHFLVVTILITVLTNSFMAIVQNANEEHQFLFAVNTISMVKSDALFSYIAPTNIVAWLLTPLRYFLPFRRYVKINRTAIKITHFPILFSIYLYERTILRSQVFEPIDIVQPRGRSPGNANRETGIHLFSPRPPRLVREPSVATYHKDRALEEVFRRPFKDTVRETTKSRERRKTSNVVNNWMQGMGPHGVASPPAEQDRSIVDRLESRRPTNMFRSQILQRRRDFTDANRSVASDPEDFMSNADYLMPPKERFRGIDTTPSPRVDLAQQTDADGDDEAVTNDNEDEDKMTLDHRPFIQHDDAPSLQNRKRPDYFSHSPTPNRRSSPPPISSSFSSVNRARFISPPPEAQRPKSRRQSPNRKFTAELPHHHTRTISTNTVLYNPVSPKGSDEDSSSPKRTPATARNSGGNTATGGSGGATPSGRRTPKKTVPGAARARPIMPPKSAFMSAPNLAGLLMSEHSRRRAPSLGLDLGSDIGDNKAVGGGFVGAIPGSFATQMGYATHGFRRANAGMDEDSGLMGRLMLARMNNLEEGFREVLNEVREAVGKRDESLSRSPRRPAGGGGSGTSTRPGSSGVTKRDGRRKEREFPKKLVAKRETDRKGKEKADSVEDQGEGVWVDEDDQDLGPRLKGSSV